MNKITPLLKGLIAGVAMVAINLVLLQYQAASNAQFIFYILYVGAIAWTLIDYRRSPAYQHRFGAIFGQGFRCFVVITLVTVIFVGVYASRQDVNKIGEELRTELIREEQERAKKGEPTKLPGDVDEDVANFKKNFVTSNVSLATFSTLITGAIFTAAGAVVLLLRKR